MSQKLSNKRFKASKRWMKTFIMRKNNMSEYYVENVKMQISFKVFRQGKIRRK